MEIQSIHEEKVITETEQRILNKRRDKKITSDKVFSLCGVAILSKVYKECGGKAVILYFALLGNSKVVEDGEKFKLFKSTLAATELNKSDLSKATSKLEYAGYIKVFREPGHKNLFILTAKGQKGLVKRKN